MTVDEFDRLVKIGHGRAVVFLRKTADRAPYRDVVIRAVTRQEDYRRNEYLNFLLSCFESDEALKLAAIDSAGQRIETHGQVQIEGSELLKSFAADGCELAAEKLDKLCAEFYAEVEQADSGVENAIDILYVLAHVEDSRVRELAFELIESGANSFIP